MPEILTESFCERCGTRYTFEAAIPKKRRIGQLKVLSKGLKNYVLSDDASLDEALAQARSEEQRELSGDQLDAFHQAFQFCMSCRQYTCANCWNEAEGRCLSCAPLSIGVGQLGSPLDDLLAGGGMAPLSSPMLDVDPADNHSLNGNGNGNGNGHALLDDAPAAPVNGSAWPTIDLFRAPDEQAPVEAPDEPAAEPASGSFEAAPAPEALIEADTAPVADFWAHPFTGFAPVEESTNGHTPATAGDAFAAVEPVEELPEIADDLSATDSPIVEPDEDRIARAVSPQVEPGPVEIVSQSDTSGWPVASSAAVDPSVDARADELAARTSRLLGRFRVQPAGSDSGPVIESPAEPAQSFAAPSEPRVQVQPELVAEPEPVVEPEPAIEPQPEPVVAAQPEPQPEPVAAQPAPRPAPVDRVEMPAWPTPAVRTPTEAPQWPAPLRPR